MCIRDRLEVAREKKKIVVFSGPGTERITNDLCSPYSVHYTYCLLYTSRCV